MDPIFGYLLILLFVIDTFALLIGADLRPTSNKDRAVIVLANAGIIIGLIQSIG